MTQLLKRELRSGQKSFRLWLILVIIFTVSGFVKYDAMLSSSAATDAMMDAIPRVMRVMFGMNALPISTPLGYYAMMMVWISLLLFARAGMIGATILIKEERDKTADFLLVKPITRSDIVTGKLLAACFDTFVITLLFMSQVLITFRGPIQESNITMELYYTVFGLFLVQLLFFACGLLLSTLVKRHQRAMAGSLLFVFGSYFLSTAIELSGELDFLRPLTPFRYFDVAELNKHGHQPIYPILSVVIILLATTLTYRFYQKRDVSA